MTHITVIPDGRETAICMMEVIKFHKIYMTHKQIGPIKKNHILKSMILGRIIVRYGEHQCDRF